MKAIRFHQYGDPDVLRHEDVEVPVPGPGEVRIRVAGTTFNGVDGNIRAGNMQGPMPLTLPHVPGLDVAGTVDELGADVRSPAVGDRVVGFLPFVVDGASGSTSSRRPTPSRPLPRASRSPTPPRCRWSGSRRTRRSSTTPTCSPGSASWSTGRAARSAGTPSSWPRPSAPT